MSRSVFPAALAALAVATGCFAGTGDSGAPPRLADTVAGWSVAIPPEWRTGRAVVATAFARGARCRSVWVADRVEEGGPGPSDARSFVQVCARPRGDGRPLEAFLAETYGSTVGTRFAATTLGGRRALRTRRGDPQLLFLQTRTHRFQLAASAAGEPALRSRRRAQVDDVLRSFRFDGTG